MKMLEVKYPELVRYSENYSKALRYAMLKEDGLKEGLLKAYHYPVMCKDFLSDLFWSENMKKKISIYGFGWEPGTFELGRDYYLMSLDFSDENLHAKMKNLTEFMTQWESKLGLSESEFYTAKEGRIVVKFDARWAAKPIMVSLFTLLLRLGMTYPGGEITDHIAKVAKTGNNPYGNMDHAYVERLPMVWKEGKVQWGGSYKDYESDYFIHNKSGIVNAK